MLRIPISPSSQSNKQSKRIIPLKIQIHPANFRQKTAQNRKKYQQSYRSISNALIQLLNSPRKNPRNLPANRMPKPSKLLCPKLPKVIPGLQLPSRPNFQRIHLLHRTLQKRSPRRQRNLVTFILSFQIKKIISR